VKRNPATRKTAKKKRPLSAKPLRELWKRSPDGSFGLVPGVGGPQGPQPDAIDGVPIPADLDAVIGFHAGECLLNHRCLMKDEPWFYWWLRLGYDGEEYDNGTVDQGLPRYFFYSNNGIWPAPPKRIDDEGNDLSDPDGWNGESLELSERQWFAVGVAMRDAMREGFQLALLRYAEELKHVPEAAAVCKALERGRKKGGATNHKKAEPQRLAIRKRFRELRKSGFSPTAARKVLEQEAGKSFRQIERDTKGLS
jgi:hypothetical protein